MSQPESGIPWYALQVRPRYEHLVSSVLQNKGYDPFLPTCRVTHQWSDRTVEVSQPIFPGYVFCRLDLSSRLLPVLTTPGVLRLVGFGRTPTPVEDHEIDSVRIIVESGLPSSPWPMPGIGQRVVIESGPLQGLEGVLIGIRKRRRLVVSVNLLQRAVAVEVDWDAARAIHPPARRPTSPVNALAASA